MSQLKSLAKYGAPVDGIDNGTPPIVTALCQNRDEIVLYLVEKEAKIDFKYTPSHIYSEAR